MKYMAQFTKGSVIAFVVCFVFLLGVIYIAYNVKEVGKSDEMNRSSSLQEKQIEKDDRIIIEYRNLNGVLTYASDKHFATCIKTPIETGFVVEYYDENGKPAKQGAGYYALKTKQNDDEIVEMTYLGIDHMPIMISAGYSIAKYYYNNIDRTKETRLYDTQGEPVQTFSYGNGYIEQYNEQGQIVSTIYIDEIGKPTIIGQGFAIKHMKYYDTGDSSGKVEYVYYFDENEQPIQLNLGQYGVHIEYDELGREKKATYLNKNGQPTVTKLGYTIVEFTRYDDDSIKTETYYDQDGIPVKLFDGQYGKKYTLDGKTHYLDINGKTIINVKLGLYNNELLVVLSCATVVVISILLNKKRNYVVLILYLLAIIYMTLLSRNSAGISRYNHGIIETLRKLYTSFESRKDLYNNIILFIPLGTILYKLYSRPFVLIFPIIFSVLIEMIQYYTGIGYCEIIDIMSNSIGGTIGYCIGKKLYNVK